MDLNSLVLHSSDTSLARFQVYLFQSLLHARHCGIDFIEIAGYFAPKAGFLAGMLEELPIQEVLDLRESVALDRLQSDSFSKRALQALRSPVGLGFEAEHNVSGSRAVGQTSWDRQFRDRSLEANATHPQWKNPGFASGGPQRTELDRRQLDRAALDLLASQEAMQQVLVLLGFEFARVMTRVDPCSCRRSSCSAGSCLPPQCSWAGYDVARASPR